MKLQIKSFLTAAILALAAVSTPARSQDTGWYAGFALGQGSHDVDCSFTITCDDKDTAWKLFGGYQFNKNLGVEAGYVNFGKVGGTDVIFGTFEIKPTGFEVLAVGTLPINPQFDVYGKLGLFSWDLDASDAFGKISESGTDLTFGIGVKYNFAKNVGIRLEWQRYNDIGNESTTGTSDSDFIGVGLVFKF